VHLAAVKLHWYPHKPTKWGQSNKNQSGNGHSAGGCGQQPPLTSHMAGVVPACIEASGLAGEQPNAGNSTAVDHQRVT